MSTFYQPIEKAPSAVEIRIDILAPDPCRILYTIFCLPQRFDLLCVSPSWLQVADEAELAASLMIAIARVAAVGEKFIRRT